MPSRTPPGNTSGGSTDPSETRWAFDCSISVTEASTLANVSDETIRSWYDTGEITGIRDERGRRIIDRESVTRRLNSMGVVEAARLVDRTPYMVRQWFDLGLVDGYLTTTGRRRIFRESLIEYVAELADRIAAKEPT